MIQGPIIWEALEYDHVEKSRDWYIAVGIVSASIVLILIILSNYVFAIMIAVSVFSLIVAAKRAPKLVRFELNKSGLVINRDFKAFATLRSFWVDNNSHHDGKSTLYFRQRATLSIMISIPIEEVDAHDVREFLLHHLLEEEHTEPVLHRIFEKLGF